MNAHIDSQSAAGDRFECDIVPSGHLTLVVFPTVVVISRRRMARPSSMADRTDPPSESNTINAPRRLLVPAKASKSAAVVSVTGPIAEIQACAGRPPHEGTSEFHSNFMVVSLGASFAAQAIVPLAALTRSIEQAADTMHPSRCDFTPIPLPQSSLIAIPRVPSTSNGNSN